MAKKNAIIIEELTDLEVVAEQQAETVTLADMPERVPCLCVLPGLDFARPAGRVGETVLDVARDGKTLVDRWGGYPSKTVVLSRLDGHPLPVKIKPLPKTLADCPAVTERAVVYEAECGRSCARIGDEVWRIVHNGGGAHFLDGNLQYYVPRTPTNLRLTVKTEGGEDA